ncbi:MAG: FAD-binding protein [Cyclobacteriaceae bacterium]|nr:FAD-binding protein [Cyclobacteriaceae bacterium]
MDQRLISISRTRKTWKNATRNVMVSPLRLFFPETPEDIAHIIRDAETNHLCVRAVGSGHSFSPVAISHDYLLNMRNLRKVHQIDKSSLKPEARAHPDFERYYVKAEAGITVKELNRQLDNMGLALRNMGAVNFQTVSGALSTATHGSGIAQPAFPDMVRSLYVAGADGKFFQIEPADGITDPGKFSSERGEQLIQDDDIFYSVLVSFGAMGIIYAVNFEVVPEFLIKEMREMTDWNTLKQQLISGHFIEKVVRKYEYVSFRVNPYAVNGRHLCAVVKQEILPGKPKLSLNSRFKNLKSSIFGNIPLLPTFLIWYLNIRPKAAIKSIDGFLEGTKDKVFIGKSHRTLYQSGTNIKRHGISSEFAFPVDPEKIVEIIEKIFVQAEKNIRDGNLYQTSHIPVRFVQASKAYLSTAYGRETAYIDIPLLQKTIGDYEILDRYQDIIISEGGIPHWGKINNRLYSKHDITRKNFPELTKWQKVRRQLDPRDTFINAFIEKTGLLKDPGSTV